jgi:hypothetical protein
MAMLDVGWISALGLASRREEGSLSGQDWVLLAFPETSVHHSGRFLMRLLVYSGRTREPLLSIDLERDILGGFVISLRRGEVSEALFHPETAPDLGRFRSLALVEASRIMAAAHPASGHSGPRLSFRH